MRNRFDSLNDNSLMPFGSHKGKKLANVPGNHLLWLFDQPWFNQYSKLGRYISDNQNDLKKGK